ncbi:MAG: hypothetical protein HYR88_05465 [Verrucomicrobia bacterium]|nr:hypothetical protein [Verrucomicrobiota bacterium]MBI3869209.1 hypothetical protein [Verrucomicrobiota bacterium]
MSDAVLPPPLPPSLRVSAVAPSISGTLRQLYLKLFLRGRSSRGVQKGGAPKSVRARLGYALFFYVILGLLCVGFMGQPVFALSLYIHSTTLMFLAMFVASSAGEVLFNKEEADILMHRPVPSRALLWAKISVLLQVALWLAGALNLGALMVGIGASDGGWSYPLAHAASTVLEALFCAGSVVLMYQLCLRWLGRERLDGLMTTAQVLLAMATVLGSQLAPRLIGRMGKSVFIREDTWWMPFLPPAWFAGLDDALSGGGAARSWALGGLGVALTGLVSFLAFGKLAATYEQGLQTLNERANAVKPRGARRWLSALVSSAPLRWWLKDSVARASFLLAGAYLARDRDVKLRIFPALAPVFVMPVILWNQDSSTWAQGFGIAFGGVYLGMAPMEGLNLLRYSQQWQAADIFRAAPLPGPGPLCHGARRAVLCLITLPAVLIYALLALALSREPSILILILPGMLALPVFAMIPCLRGQAVPLSLPPEEAHSAGRGVRAIAVMAFSAAIPSLALWARSAGRLGWFLAIEALLMGTAYFAMRRSIRGAAWPSIE